MHGTGQRLSELIDALLKLAHIIRMELRPSPVDLSAIAARVVQELREAKKPYVVVAFLGTECPVVKRYASRLQSLAGEYEARGIAVIGAIFGASAPDVAARDLIRALGRLEIH